MGQNTFVRFSSRGRSGEYLNIESGAVSIGPTAPGWLSQRWQLESIPGTPYVRFRSVWKPNAYLHVEHGIPEAGSIEPGWLSARWLLDDVPDTKFFTLRNGWNLTQYAHVQHGLPDVGQVEPGWLSAHWQLEPVEGTSFVRLRNRWRPDDCLHIESGQLAVGAISAGWLSAQWSIEPFPGSPYVRFRNRWKPQYLHAQNGKAEAGAIPPEWLGARWYLEDVPGTPFVYLKNAREFFRHLYVESGAVHAGSVAASSARTHWARTGPFDAEVAGFGFQNDFSLTASQAAQAREIIPGAILDLVHLTVLNEIKGELESIKIDPPGPGSVSLLDALGGTAFLTAKLSVTAVADAAADLPDRAFDPLASGIGYCGGMAFGGYDFFLQGWPVSHFGTAPPSPAATDPVDKQLHAYIFQRLLDSLELNGATFVDWWTKVHVLPRLSGWVSQLVLASAGTVGGPLGVALGWWIGGRVELFELGGPKRLLQPTIRQWRRIKRKLDAEPAWPVGLVFGNLWNLFDQHQVLATGYTDNGHGMATLDIWDNNDGAALNRLTIDFGGDMLDVSSLPGLSISSGKEVRGIFLEDYAPRQPPPALKAP